tara:strand:- start:5205 stop:6428 length:1224 start_codon:yes stop_codon:yes gene_type:complete
MYDASFNPRTLNLFEPRDFDKDRSIRDANVRDRFIEQAHQLAQDGFTHANLNSHSVKGRTVYQTNQWADTLVLRKIDSNIKQITRVRQSNRLDIMRSIRSLCSEGVPYRVYKLDIERFYESVDTEDTIAKLQKHVPHTPSTVKLLSTFLSACSNTGILGIPRGLSLSSTLSEYLLRDFDRTIRKWDNVFYFSRFVDDMIVISRGDEDPHKFLHNVTEKLPSGLNLHPSKTHWFDFAKFDKTKEGIAGTLDFLGYQICIYHVGNDKQRQVVLDLAPKKIKRTKTRLVLSFRQYLNDRNFKDLEDRIRLLTGNYSFLDHRDNQFRQAGVFYNYRLINQPSAALSELDLFLKKFILSTSGKHCRLLSSFLRKQEKNALLKYSFDRGYSYRHHFEFKNERLEKLMRCWKYA